MTAQYPPTGDVTTTPAENPLASAQFRYDLRVPATSATAGPDATRPFGLRFAKPHPTPVIHQVTYSHQQQVAVDDDGRPLIETMGKEWKSKSSKDGDEGPEENWGWEEA